MATTRTDFSATDMTEFAGHVASFFAEYNLVNPDEMIYRDLTGTKTAKIPINVAQGTAHIPHKTDRTGIGSNARRSASLSVGDPLESNETIAREELRKHRHNLLAEKAEDLGREVAETWLEQCICYMQNQIFFLSALATKRTADVGMGNLYLVDQANLATPAADAATVVRDAVLAVAGMMDKAKMNRGWQNRKMLLNAVMFNQLFTLDEVQNTNMGGPAAIRDLGGGNLFYGDMHIKKCNVGFGIDRTAVEYSGAFTLSGDVITKRDWADKYLAKTSALRAVAWCKPTVAMGWTTPPPMAIPVTTELTYESHIKAWLASSAFEGDLVKIHEYLHTAGTIFSNHARGIFGIAHLTLSGLTSAG